MGGLQRKNNAARGKGIIKMKRKSMSLLALLLVFSMLLSPLSSINADAAASELAEESSAALSEEKKEPAAEESSAASEEKKEPAAKMCIRDRAGRG